MIRALLLSLAGAGLLAAQAPTEILTAVQERLSQSDLPGARARLETALRRYPGDARLYNLQGIAAAQANDYSGAEAAFRRAVHLEPGLTGAWLNLGRFYQTNVERDRQALDKGVAVYRHLLAGTPDLPEANYQLALLLQWRGDFQESLAHLDRLPPQDRARTGALAVRCADQAGTGDIAGASATARQLLSQPGIQESDVVTIVPVLEKLKRDEVSRVLLEGLAERKLASQESLTHLAAIYERTADLKRSRATYELVAQDQPTATGPLLDLARVAWKEKDYEGTLGYLAHARELEPKNAAIHFLFGLTCNEMHLLGEASKSLEQALQLAPDNPYYNYAMGVVQMGWTDKQKALPYLRKYTAMKPDDPRGRLALATAYFLMYEQDAAKAELARIASAPSVKPAVEFMLGCIARQEGALEDAAAHLRAALRLSPNLAEAHAELGLVLLRQEDLAGAERETTLALQQDPDSFTANQALMELYRARHDPRMQAQVKRLSTLVEDRNRKMQLMLRTIEVRPY